LVKAKAVLVNACPAQPVARHLVALLVVLWVVWRRLLSIGSRPLIVGSGAERQRPKGALAVSHQEQRRQILKPPSRPARRAFLASP
jgi:hypothetical protein